MKKIKLIFVMTIIFSMLSLSVSAVNITCNSGDLSTTCTVSASQTITEDVSCNNLIITNNSALTLDSLYKVGGAGQITITCSGNLTVESGAKISGDGEGYSGGSGYPGTGSGPGGGGGNSAYTDRCGPGAGYGGIGGSGYANTGGGTFYGSVTQPADLGSGGGGTYQTNRRGGSGGGAVNLEIAETFILNGAITSNGGNGLIDGGLYIAYSTGGGSGGSIMITANIFTGSGSLSANGGNGGDDSKDGGGGAGGRIAVNFINNTFTGTKTAYGGWGYQYGGAGTIYLKPEGQSGDLIIDNNNNSGQKTPLDISLEINNFNLDNKGYAEILAGNNLTIHNTILNLHSETKLYSYGIFTTPYLEQLIIYENGYFYDSTAYNLPNLQTLIIDGDYLLADMCTAPNLQIINISGTYQQLGNLDAPNLKTLNIGGTFELSGNNIFHPAINIKINSGGNLTHKANNNVQLYILNLTAANLTIDAGGIIDVDAKGYSGGIGWPGNGYGPGAGKGLAGADSSGSGAGYGGVGGGASGIGGGTSYGSLTQPVDLGSGGGGTYNSHKRGGAGGGAVNLEITETFVLNGAITSNGGNGQIDGGTWTEYACGGGSGGSILITANIFTGAGSLSANGGAGGNDNRDGGGGAGGRIAVHFISDTFTGPRTVNGGWGYNYGANGTINASERPKNPVYSNFISDETTNLSAEVDFTNVTNITLAIPNKGKIKFPSDHIINTEYENYDINIKIENSLIFVNSAALHPTFNTPATLTFEGVNCNAPYVYYSETASTMTTILAEDAQCPSSICTNIQCTDSTLTVDVAHFSGYAVNGSSNLTIDADDPKYVLDDVNFTAIYMNSTGFITDATCTITFSDLSDTMDEQADHYNYTRTFASGGLKDYNVTCSATGENTVFANDTAVINESPVIPEFSAMTLGLGLIAVLAGLYILRKKQ